MNHKHICYDCNHTIATSCQKKECVLEPDADVVYEQCSRCAKQPVRYGDENPNWEKE